MPKNLDGLIDKGVNMYMRLIMLIAFIFKLEIGYFLTKKLKLKKLRFQCLEKWTFWAFV